MQEMNVALGQWAGRSNELLQRVRDEFKVIDYSDSALPQSVFTADKPLSIVFAGQYSAGKSTILKALTGIENIAVGEGITTQVAHTYDWNGIQVIDTPGIHTRLRPDHDEISYQAMTSADMLVYVVTKELFDDFIGQNFRKLLIDADKAGEMILVVNKMADVGNTPENRRIKEQDLEKVTHPYTPKDLHVVFIDAESYVDSRDETDEEIAAELVERSNYEEFVSVLNDFIREKEMPSRMTTALYEMDACIRDAMKEYQPSVGDNDVDAVEEHLRQERHIVQANQWRLETAVKAAIEDAVAEIHDVGREIANAIYDYDSEDAANTALEAAYNKVEHISDDCVNRIEKEIEKVSRSGGEKLDAFYGSAFSKDLEFRLNPKNGEGNPLVEKILKGDFLEKAGKNVADYALANPGANGLRQFAGGNAHALVKDIGHFFGHNFKPWEAVKFAKGINVAGKALGVFGVILSVGMQAKEDQEAEQRAQDMRKGRESVRGGFSQAAQSVSRHFRKALANLLEENYIVPIHQIDVRLAEIEKMRAGRSATYDRLTNLQQECQNLISDIHRDAMRYTEMRHDDDR